MPRFLISCLSLAAATTSLFAAERPNVLLVMTDDLGFSDLGCYGGEVETPTLDRLAKDGLRFSQFYNTAKCHSSRVSLLSGLWCQQAGDTSLQRAITIPEALAPAGYFTAMIGKWHLDKEPTDFGFQRYFGHLSGAVDYFQGNDSFRLNGNEWPIPEEGFYTTITKVDYALEFLQEARETKKPWFLYLAFNAPHAPLQPLKADYQKYLNRYQVGWDVINAERAAKQSELALFGKAITPSERPGHLPAWESLTPELQDWEARRMAALAALVDRVDQEMARLVADLEKSGELENTLILFVNDNGACPYDRTSRGREKEPYETGASWSDSTGWAWARNTPFRFYKQNQFEGGITSPAIAHWPAGIKAAKGSITSSPAHLVDILPTLLAMGKATLPADYEGRDPQPLAGTSLLPIFAGERPESRPPLHFLFATDRGFREGDWKIVSRREGPWELYHLGQDRTERVNLAAKHPEIVERLTKQWHQMTAEVLRATPRQQAPVRATNSPHPEWSDYSGKNGTQTQRTKNRAPRRAKEEN